MLCIQDTKLMELSENKEGQPGKNHLLITYK